MGSYGPLSVSHWHKCETETETQVKLNSMVGNSQVCGYSYVATSSCMCANLPRMGYVVMFYLR